MAIPSWQRILDTEMDAESPITESLIKRLYKNMFAVMGLDYDSATKPVFQIVPSLMHRGSVEAIVVDPVSIAAYHYSNDILVSVNDSQALDLSRCYGGDNTGSHIKVTSAGPSVPLDVVFSGFEVDWSGGAPANVVLVGHTRAAMTPAGMLITSLLPRGAWAQGLPVNNSYYDLFNMVTNPGGVLAAQVSAKAQVVGNATYVRFRFYYFTGSACYFNFSHHRTIYTPKV